MTKYTYEQKLQAVLDYKAGNGSLDSIVFKLSNGTNKSNSILHRWIKAYDAFGPAGLKKKHSNNTYTKEFRNKIVEEYLNGGITQEDLCIKYNISGDSVLSSWITAYNSHIELKDYRSQGEVNVYMATGKKTTFEERLEIVKYCIDHDRDYSGTAAYFQVSYQQVFNWTKKYTENGEDGLLDKRGKRKTEEELSEVESLQRKIDLLEHQLKMKEMENKLLKKVQEIERRRSSRK